MAKSMQVAWGAKVDDSFIASVIWIVEDLEIGEGVEDGTSILMACMAWESGRSFDPGKKNLAGSGATGLIQFMPSTAKALGTTVAKLAAMSPVEQLNYVWKYFKGYKGKLKTLADLYMAILWPKAVGKPSSYVLWQRDAMPTTFRQNAGLDKNKDGAVTKAECAVKLTAMLAEGFTPRNVRTYNFPLGNKETAVKLPPVVSEAMSDLKDTVVDAVEAQATQVVTETAAPAPEPTVLQQVDKHIGGKVASWGGVAVILATVMANPDFTKAFAGFLLSLSKGEGGWGALATLAGGALIAWKSSAHR